MVDFKHIYRHRAPDYNLLVSYEDYQHHIAANLQAICDLSDQQVVEFGAGTGRLTRILAPVAATVHATDNSAHMLRHANVPDHCTLTVADNRRMPFPDACADITVAGWNFGHLVGWYPETWPQEIDAAVREMERVVRPGGVAIIFETMGTGHETPQPPTTGLAAYYQHLEQHHSFSTTTFRTDYRFRSVEEGARLTRFFFGDELADRIITTQQTILPECTGMWWRQL